ncbi:unnamed protein product [Cylicocyclus nassatus]|uniref:Uncharacterized protein n=1 Tax=Cylicocyclus nassatus TaxID=53992 RepID=A0AA36GF79_CYLNA|nr:unnamed protein product [Cylicocyclus nassatus]
MKMYIYICLAQKKDHDKWELFLDAEADQTQIENMIKCLLLWDIEKAYKEVHGKLLKMPPFGTAGEDLKAAYERELGLEEQKRREGQECSIRITFPTEDNLWFICPTYAKFTKFLNEVVKNYVVGLEQGKDNMTVCKEVLEHLRKNGGGYINKDQFDDDGHSAFGQIRDWGNWENPSDAADEEDYDWQVLTDSSSKKLDELLDEVRAKYSNTRD